MTAAPLLRASPRRGVLALDFDGVIADGSTECALVTWNAHFQRPVHDFSEEGLARVPETFLARFEHARGHCRHLGHFIVPLLAESEPPRTQVEFNAYFARIPRAVVDRFVADATRYRGAARRRYPHRWMAYHGVYDGLVATLSTLTDPWYVVTAKDRDSVQQILAANGILLPPSRIYGEQSDKAAALRDIARRAGVTDQEVHFVDDSLANVATARDDGHDAVWARWGFHTSEHETEALRLGVPSCTLADFPAVLGRLLSPARP